jgi:hypothetical protein
MKNVLKTSLILLFFGYSNCLYSQSIICVDTITKPVYFCYAKFKMPSGTKENESQVFKRGYSIDIATAKSLTIDSIYFKYKYGQSDTVKYLSYSGDKLSGIKKYFKGENCINLYQKVLTINHLLKPKKYFKIKGLKKYDRGTAVGLSFAIIQWLHLKISDDLATDGFNEPPTLHLPNVTSRMYDIYLPLKVVRIDNNVVLKKRFILMKN